jgi:hypothetical protein
MSEKKYAQYVITEDVRMEIPPNSSLQQRMKSQRDAGDYLDAFHMLGLNEKMIKGSLYFDAVWITGLHGTHGFQVEIQHAHDFDEIIAFFGSNKDNYRDLGAEIEFWLEDEQYILNKSAIIYVPANMKHLPLYFRKITSPFLFFTTGHGKSYERTSGKEF